MANVTEHTVTSLPHLRMTLLSGVKVYHLEGSTGKWWRVLGINDIGEIRELALTPLGRQWDVSWTDEHKKGRIRTAYTDLFRRGDKLVTKLPPVIMSLLEKHDCLSLVDKSLFS